MTKVPTIKILRDIRDGINYASVVAKKHDISRQAVSKRFKHLTDLGYIEEDVKEGKGKVAIFYKLTSKGKKKARKHIKKSRRKKGKKRSITTGFQSTEVYIHSFRIKFPLISDNSKDFWEKESDMAYGKKYYHWTENVTIEKISSTILFHVRFPVNAITSKEFDEKFEKEIKRIIGKVAKYCADNNITIDSEIKSDSMIEFAINDPITQIYREIGTKIGEFLDLKRLREKIFEKGLDQDAWVKFDATPWKPITRETNDRLHLRKVLNMPEILDRMSKEFTPAIKELTKQINLHLKVQENTLEIQKETQKTMKAIREELKKPEKELRFKTIKGEQIVKEIE